MKIHWLASGCLTLIVAACGGSTGLGDGSNGLNGTQVGGSGGVGTGTGGAPAVACQTDKDCPAVDLGAPCHACPDGTASCPGSMCVAGACQIGWPTCGGSGGGSTGGFGGGVGGECKSAVDCGAVPGPCQVCPDGSVTCPSIDCVNGMCVGSVGGCAGGTGGSGGGSQCSSSKDCPQMGMPCQLCPDGTTACPSVDCINGECIGSIQTCGGGTGGSGGGAQCASDKDCVAPMVCQACPDGSNSCATAACVGGVCETSFPACGGGTPGCKSDAECPSPMMPCKLCPDGTAACPAGVCANGSCQISFPTCNSYDPCAGQACGASCSVCDPKDPTCVGPAVLTFCDANGQCSAQKPTCGGGGMMCKTQMDCPMVDICKPCPNGQCASIDCLNGACTMVCPL